MADRQKGMGRGFGGNPRGGTARGRAKLRQIPLELISPNPNQPRGRFDEEALNALGSLGP